MNNISPPKSTTNKILFSKNIRLNLNPKFIPEDFFPESISQYSRSRKMSQKSTFFSTPQSLENNKIENNEEYLIEELKHIDFLKKRLIRLKEKIPNQHETKAKSKSEIKKSLLPIKLERTFTMKEKQSEIKENLENPKSRKNTKKMIDYMEKMKKVININIKFEEDLVSPTYKKRPLEWTKENYDDLETDDSPKLIRFRPKSEFSSREKIPIKESAILETKKLSSKIFKMKGKEAKNVEEKDLKINNRYGDFGDLQVNEEGMLTFYGSFNHNIESYNSRKYQTRTSLPKLEK